MNAIAQSTFNPSLAVINGTIKTTSLKVAEHFGKRHDSVLRAINNIECSPEFTDLNFVVSEYKDASGKSNPYYEMTKDGFVFLAMGFTGKTAAQWKEAYINAFNAMTDKLSSKQNTSPHITEFEAYQFVKSVKAHCKGNRALYSYMYSGIYEYYGITSYKNIPAGHLKEAVEMVCGIKLVSAGNAPKLIEPKLTYVDVIKTILEIRDQEGDKAMAELRQAIRIEEIEKLAYQYRNDIFNGNFLVTVSESRVSDIKII